MIKKLLLIIMCLFCVRNAYALDRIFTRDDITGQSKYSNTITGATKIYFRDSGIYIWSSGDGYLNLVADSAVEINSLVLNTADLYASGTSNVIIIPTVDPHVAGAIWNDAGTLKVSAG